MVSINYFREFLTLSQILNFRAAAESLYMTQPVLSKHISALEASLDVQLFERSKQYVKLTPAGELLKTRIRPLLEDYDDICSCLRILKSNYSNRLRIGCPYYAIQDYLSNIPELFSSEYSDVKLLYSVGDPFEILQMLLEKKIDLAFVPKYPFPGTDNLKYINLYKEPLGVLLSTANPLAKSETLSLKDLKPYTFFSVGNSYFEASWNHTVRLCQAAGFTPSGPALFNQMESLIMAVRRGDGVAVIGRHMRSQESDLVAYRPLSDANASRMVGIWYDPDNTNEAILKFVNFYQKTIKGFSKETDD